MASLPRPYGKRTRGLVSGAFVVLAGTTLGPLPVEAEWLVNGNRICEAPSPKFNPAIVASGTDGFIVAWTDDRNYDGATDIYAARILLNGERDSRWPVTGLPVCTARGSQFAPRVVSDGSGGAIVAWVDDRDGLFGVFAHRITVAGSIVPGWPMDGVRLCAGVGGIAEAVNDGVGGAIAVWRDVQSGVADIRAQRVTASGSIAAGWPQNGLILVPGDSRPNVIVHAASDGQGGAIVTWYTLVGPMDIYAQRVTPSGTLAPGWPAAGVVVCDAPGGQFNPRAATDGNGGAFIVWSDLRTENEDIYVGHVLGTGSRDPEWPANGVLACGAPNVQQNPRVVSDQAGGCIAVWMDFRGGLSYDIYAQRITGAGLPAVGWSQDGEALCTAAGHQFELIAISDGSEGMISVWRDARVDAGDIYAQRVTTIGSPAPGWVTNGVLVADPPNDQGGVALASDGRGGAMICWGDRRFDQLDVYVQRVAASGAVGPGIPPEPIADKLQLSDPWPNPASDKSSLGVRLPTASLLTVEVVDVTGRRIATLQDRMPLPAGDHTITWDGGDDHGRPVSSGLYVIRATTGRHTVSRKIVRL